MNENFNRLFAKEVNLDSRIPAQELCIPHLQQYLKQTIIGTIIEINESFMWIDLGNNILCKILNNDLFFHTGYTINFIKAAFLVGEKIPIYIKCFSKTNNYFIGSYRYAFPEYSEQKTIFKLGQILCCIITSKIDDLTDDYSVFVNPCVNGIVKIPSEYKHAISKGTRITASINEIKEKKLCLNFIVPYQIDDRS